MPAVAILQCERREKIVPSGTFIIGLLKHSRALAKMMDLGYIPKDQESSTSENSEMEDERSIYWSFKKKKIKRQRLTKTEKESYCLTKEGWTHMRSFSS